MADSQTGGGIPHALTVVVGVTGGIAAYKTISVVRQLALAGHDVHVVPTEAALRFVGAPTWEAISRNPVTTSLFEGVEEVRHVGLGQKADLIIIAPATANTLAKLAHGIADNLLTTTVLASAAPVVVAPAMHTAMWLNPATQANVAMLRERGVVVVGPASGRLAGRDCGPGRMEEPETIVRSALDAVDAPSPRVETPSAAAADGATPAGQDVRDLSGLRIVVTAGGTREPFDPVRFIGNRSSGKQGMALAANARARGAEVTLIAANIDAQRLPASVTVVPVCTTLELMQAVDAAAAGADAVIMAAAVADYRPAQIEEHKIKKERTGDHFTVDFVTNPDILAGLSANRPQGQMIIGFAAETEPDRARLIGIGRDKIRRKGCDFLVINAVGWNTGFGTDDNEVLIMNQRGDIVAEHSGSKQAVAGRILDVALAARMRNPGT